VVIAFPTRAGEAHSCINQNHGDPVSYQFLQGTATLYSHRSPDKSGDNEDSAALIRFNEDSGVAVVADGLGGVAGGAEASRTVIETLVDEITSAQRSMTLRDIILNGIDAANRALLSRGLGNATTLAITEINSHCVRTYHIGDAVVLVTGQRGKVKLQTLSHSPTGYAIESGLLDEDEAMDHEERHLVSNVVGSPEMRIEMGPDVVLAARDTLLVASDGLFDNLYVEEIVELSRKGVLTRSAKMLSEQAAARMRTAQQGAPSHPDDLTFILYRRDAPPRRAVCG